MPVTVQFRGSSLALTTRTEVLSAIDKASSETPVRIATANPEFIEEATHNAHFRNALASMSHVTVDGSGLYFFLKALQKRLGKEVRIEKYPGVDMVFELFKKFAAAILCIKNCRHI